MSEKVPAKRDDLRSMIASEQYQKQWGMVLPKHLTPERMTRVALTALTKTPKLMECSKATVMSCLLDCASMGLEPDGRRAHLIPFGGKCTLIIDYKGLAELAMRSGLVSHIHADLVCDNDIWDENLGRVLTHKINRRQPRGEIYAAYSHVVMKDGTESFEIMSKDEIDKIRNRSRAKDGGPWVTDYGEMAKKTVFRRHAKWLPLSPEFRDALDKDDTMPTDIGAQVEVSEPVVAVPKVSDGKAVTKPTKPKKSKKKEETPPPEDPPEQVDAEEPGPQPQPAEGRPQEPEPQPVEEETPDGGPFAAPTAGEREDG